MIDYLLYILVLTAYAPGIIYIIRYREIFIYPIISFCFLGMFIFNAVGSIIIINREYPMLSGSIVTPQYIGILILQVCIFYLIAWPYINWRKASLPKINVNFANEYIFLIIIGLLTFTILFLYYKEVGNFLIFELIKGNMNHANLLKYRELTYGLINFKYYRLGFLVFPSILSAHIFLIDSFQNCFKIFHLFIISICLIPPILLGEKSGILYITIILIICYSVNLSVKKKSFIEFFKLKTIIAILSALIPTILIYQLYYSGLAKTFKFSKLIYRIVGVYSESIALSVKYVENNGKLLGKTLPTIKGLLKHNRFNIETALHKYLSSLFGDIHTTTTTLKGNIPFSAVTEGYINFGWIGVAIFSSVSFLTLIVFQEVFLRIKLGVLSYTLMVWYAYLALNLSMYSAFYTIFSIIHTLVCIGLICLYSAIVFINKRVEFKRYYSIR